MRPCLATKLAIWCCSYTHGLVFLLHVLAVPKLSALCEWSASGRRASCALLLKASGRRASCALSSCSKRVVVERLARCQVAQSEFGQGTKAARTAPGSGRLWWGHLRSGVAKVGSCRLWWGHLRSGVAL
eukprot:366563-Chlamydomonas_euryale.AAC.16